MGKVAVIDIGTVTARLAVATVGRGRATALEKRSTICNLGENLTRTGRISDAARQRVTGCVAGYVARAREAGVTDVACTLTSAARDAANSDELLDALGALDLRPQVIPGEVEGSLTLLGVAQDFPGERILVADNGGGSTELAIGTLEPDASGDGAGRLDIDAVRSENVGARRVTELFLSRSDPPSTDDVTKARKFADERFAAAVREERIDAERPSQLVVTGGTATTLVALDAGLDPYDSSYVHLHELKRDEVEALLARLASITVAERARLKGIQAKRAPVILGGTICLAELMAQTGFSSMRVSESDLLVGLSLVADAVARGDASPIGWAPELAVLD